MILGMSWFEIAVFIIRELPEAVSALSSIIHSVHGLPHSGELARTEIGQSIENGDKSKVLDVTKDWQVQCQRGTTGCPSDLIGD